MKITFQPDRPIGTLIEDADNPRTHSPREIDEMADVLKRFGGMPSPVLVGEDDIIIAGHRRKRAAAKLGWKTVPTMVIEGLSPAERKALAIADNQIPTSGGWDEALLRTALDDLKTDGVPIDGLGFSQKEISALFNDEPIAVREVKTTALADRFWINVRGDLKDQAVMLKALKDAAAKLPGVEVELGTINDLAIIG